MSSTRESGIIRSERDLTNLNIIDFGRDNGGIYGSPQDAVRSACQSSIGMSYSVNDLDISKYPDQPGWPDWRHVGNHEDIGRMYWNFFQSYHGPNGSTLQFGDSPDFSGTIICPEYKINFWGDFGQCSTHAFIESVRQMKPGDLWISVTSDKQQVALEAGLFHPLLTSYIGESFQNGHMSGLQLLQWMKSNGYDPSWTDDEYRHHINKYLITHRKNG